MRDISQSEIEELIRCPKKIIEPPKKQMKSDRGNLRNSMKLESLDGQYSFLVFMRRNEKFPEDFSIGIDLHSNIELGRIALFRCNSPHGGKNAESEDIHFSHHTHTISAQRFRKGIKKPDLREVTKEYASFEEALLFFIREVNIIDADEFITDIGQRKLQFDK